MLIPKAPAEHFGIIQIVSARDVLSRTVTSPPPLEESCSLAPHPGCGTCTVEQALRIRANTRLTHFKALQKDGEECLIP